MDALGAVAAGFITTSVGLFLASAVWIWFRKRRNQRRVNHLKIVKQEE